jgi:hypothetical protein
MAAGCWLLLHLISSHMMKLLRAEDPGPAMGGGLQFKDVLDF